MTYTTTTGTRRVHRHNSNALARAAVLRPTAAQLAWREVFRRAMAGYVAYPPETHAYFAGRHKTDVETGDYVDKPTSNVVSWYLKTWYLRAWGPGF